MKTKLKQEVKILYHLGQGEDGTWHLMGSPFESSVKAHESSELLADRLSKLGRLLVGVFNREDFGKEEPSDGN